MAAPNCHQRDGPIAAIRASRARGFLLGAKRRAISIAVRNGMEIASLRSQ